MSGKRAASKRMGASSVSQPSILSFFGKGSSTTAPPSKAANKKSIGPRKAGIAAPEGRSSTSAVSTPAAKRRKAAGAATKTVDLTAATTSEAAGDEDANTTPPPPAVSGATAAAAMPTKPPRVSPATPRTTTAPDRLVGKGTSLPTANSTPRATAASKAASTERALVRAGGAGGGGGGGGGESETPSPKTDSENSPSALSSKRAEKKGGGGAAGGARKKRSSRAALSERDEADEMGSGGVGGGEGEGEEEPGRGRNDRRLARKKRETAIPLPGGGDVRGREKQAEGSHETDGDEECSDDGAPDYTGGGGRNNRNKGEGQGMQEEEEKEEEAEDAQEEQEQEGAEDEPEPEAGAEGQEGQQAADGGISQYELQRLERIRRNQAFMVTLGLDTAKPPAPSLAASSGAAGGAKGRSKKRSRPVSRAKEKSPAVPVRRSARARGAEAVDYNEDKQAASAIATAARAAAARAPEPEPALEEVDFDDSTVLKYLCGEGGRASDHPPSASSTAGVPEGTKVVGLRVLEPGNPLAAAGLSTIYTMHFGGGGRGAPPLLAAGGKGGIVALFSTQRHQQSRGRSRSEDTDDEGDERTLMNFKAHKGWVSAVRFLEGEDGRGGEGGGGGGSCRLLSSANDSVVKLWDTSKQHRGLPRLLCTMNDLHPTRKGIFAMDSYGARVATGSKDSTVSLACLRPTGLECDRVLGDPGGSEAFHEKVVKGVSLRDEHTVASCGDDSNVRVSDLRSPSHFGVSHRLDGVHDGPCHTVRWHPLDASLLMSAGLDSTIKLHDLRRLDAPLHVFRGHCPYALARPRSIHRPEFFFPAAGADRATGNDDGRVSVSILSCGERSEKLSMYDVGSGATVSRGVLGAEASALAVGGAGWSNTSSGSGAVAAALPGGTVVLLEPVWGSD